MRLVDQSTRATIRTLTILAAAVSLLLTLVTPFAGVANASHVGGYHPTDGTLDDASFASLTDACDSNTDDIADGGEKLEDIHDPKSMPVIKIGNPGSPQTDLCEFWVDSRIDGSGNVWFYGAANRRASTGTTHIAFELLNKANNCSPENFATCNPWAERSEGTRIVGFTWQGNVIAGGSPTLWTWDDVAEEFDPGQALGGDFVGSVGDGGKFVEFAVNLTTAGILPNVTDPAAPCELIAAIIPMTLPGLSLTSQPKDVILGSTPPIQTCGSLKVIKSVTGGDDFGDEFPITVGGTGTSGVDSEDLSDDLGHNDFFTVDELKERADYTVTENLAGMTGWSIDSIVCKNPAGATVATIDDTATLTGIPVKVGELTTCTVTNSPTLPTLTLLKDVSNTNGGTAVYGDFAPTVLDGDNNVIDPDIDFQDVEAEDPYSTEVAPDTYTLGEDDDDIPPGYELSDIVCVDADDDEIVSLAEGEDTVEITLDLGDEVTCTFVNEDQPATLTLVKDLDIDYGGTLDEDDFTPTVDYTKFDDADEPTGSSVPTEPTWDTYTVPAGQYTIGEDSPLPAGYAFVSIVCVDDDVEDAEAAVIASGYATDDDLDVDFDLHNGQSVTCTITNEDLPAGLTIVKEVENRWGGTLDEDGFGLTATPIDPDELPEIVTLGEAIEFDSDDPNTTLPAGTYLVSEQQQDGYELDMVACTVGGEIVAVPTATSVIITVGNGESAVCTFTNRDVPGSLTVLKDVVNDDGGDAEADDFTPIVVFGDDALADIDWGAQSNPATTLDEDHDQAGVQWGTYTVGEDLDDMPSGYLMTGIVCRDMNDTDEDTDGAVIATLGEDATDVNVDVTAGDDIACTITNDDQPATLTLVKTVVNDDGGTLEADDFPVSLNDDEVAWAVEISIPAGEHTVSEEQQAGYLAGPWGGDCAADGTFTAELGGSYTCTITNDDLPAGLTIVKEVLIGDLDPADFPLLITDGDGVTQTVSSGQVTALPAGTYTIGEEQQDGYELVDIECDNGVVLAVDEETVTVTVGLDETVVCTISNAEVRVLPIVVEPEPLPATGLYTMRLALLSALFAALGALLLLGTRTAPATGRRRRD